MKKIFIPEIFKTALNEQGFKTHQKKNGDMTFWKVPSYKMSISFYGEESRSFYIKAYVGGLYNEQEVKLGNKCCIENNSHMHMAKLIVEEGKHKSSMYVKLGYTCYSEQEVRKFVQLMLDYLIGADITASDYMRSRLNR